MVELGRVIRDGKKVRPIRIKTQLKHFTVITNLGAEEIDGLYNTFGLFVYRYYESTTSVGANRKLLITNRRLTQFEVHKYLYPYPHSEDGMLLTGVPSARKDPT